jgi:hypothetical protein
MGFYRGANIVTDGLVLALDAANTKSYPGSGTTWSDLSGNAYNGTLTNGPTFNSANGGSIVFDGTNDFITGSIGSINAPFTFSVFGKFNNVSQTNYEYFGNIGSPTANGMISISKLGTQDPNTAYHGFMYVYTGTGDAVKTNIDLRTTQYQYLTVVTTTTAPYAKVYKNGVEGALVDTITGPINSNGSYRIGVWINTWWLNGNIANCSVYNRALSSSEITQNYNAYKSRFNL